MRVLLQRVRHASVSINGELCGKIGEGLLALVGFGQEDTLALKDSPEWALMQRKIVDLRIFPDENDKMNKSLLEYSGELLLVSQFTLYADCRKGRRPSFTNAAAPQVAEILYEQLKSDLQNALPCGIACGRFGADMAVELCNWGPVTIWLDTAELTKPKNAL